MNSQHLRTFIWLRWRLLMHQIQRSGLGNAIVLGIVATIVVLFVLGTTFFSFLGGLYFVHEAPTENVPAIVMYVWDGLVVFFLFAWGTALLAELQRSEALSLEKFLHLPVSLGGVFVINYLSSLVCITVAATVPIMVGFSFGACFSIGPAMLLVLPLLASFLLMITALSYQFQGWLASIMVNKRRRQTVIVVATICFIALTQLPNILNFSGIWDRPKQEAKNWDGQVVDEQAKKKQEEADKERNLEVFNEVKRTTSFVNLALPPGWLPLGAMALAEGRVWPALLGTLGMTLIGSASLWRAYRTTIRLYTGHFTSGKRPPTRSTGEASSTPTRSASETSSTPTRSAGETSSTPTRSASEASSPTRSASEASSPTRSVSEERPHVAAGNMLEKRLPWVSEQAAVIALGGLRSLLRAPEAKMLLLTPVVMLAIFGFMLLRRNSVDVADWGWPLLGFAAIAMSLFFLIGFNGNQFAFDRGGFRVFVLSPASRRDILLGKNLAVMPLAAALCLPPIVIAQVMFPIRIDHFLVVPVHFVSMYLLFCMLANWLSMFAPMPIAAGSMKPTKVKLIPVLLQFLFIFLLPVALAPALLPLGIDYWLQENVDPRVPVYVLSSLIVCLAVVLIYRLVLTWQGKVLQALELQILQTITTKAE